LWNGRVLLMHRYTRENRILHGAVTAPMVVIAIGTAG
jgi:hypothetical protein